MSRRPFLTRFTAPLASMLLVASATGGVLTTTAVPAAAAVSAGGFVGVTPNRLLDTRNPGQTPCLTGTRNLTVTGGTTTVPEGASAVALNVTVVSPTVPGYVTVYPAGAVRPTASNVNYVAGQVVPNGVFVKVGSGEAITLFASDGCPNVIVDVLGYFDGTTPVEPGGFVGVTPKRLVDTRNPGEGPCLLTTRNLTVTGGSTTVPEGAGAVALNVTVVSPTVPGYVTVYPAGATRPTASNVNYSAGQVVPNNVTVKVGDAGAITLFSSGGCPNVIVDVVGYYEGGSPVLEGGFVGLTPKRLVDTRNPGEAPCVGAPRNLTVTGGTTTVPDGANAVALNITVVSPSTPGYLTAFPTGATRPTASTLNYVAGQVVPNGTVVKVGDGGAITLFSSGGCPNVIVDVVGYYEGAVASPGDPTNLEVWGSNDYGQLGDPGVPASAASPLRVGTSTGWTSVSTSGSFDLEQSHTCGIRSGALYCWGINDYGQLGNGTLDPSQTPTQVGSGTTWSSVVAGGTSTCAIKADTTLWCWGDNSYGQLGDGTGSQSESPVQIALSDLDANITLGWTSVDVSQTHACAVRSTGNALWCWGDNSFGQLGDGTYDSYYAPTRIAGSASWANTSTGWYHSCSLKTNATVFCIGDASAGQLGNGSDFTPDPPFYVRATPAGDSTADWTAVTSGAYHSCARRSTGTIWCWGDGYLGQIGTGVFTYSGRPVQADSGTNWATLDAGDSHNCAIKTTGTLWCWGDGADYKTGIDTIDGVATPTQVGSVSTWSKVSAGYRNTCAIRTDTSLWCWGANDQGQLGTPSQRSGPGASPVFTDAVDVAGSHATSCVIRLAGSLWCSGSNLTGGLGDASGLDSNVPVQVGADVDWATVTAGGFVGAFGDPVAFACATKDSGTLWCWGDNSSGQLGDGTLFQSDVPNQVGSATNWSSVSAGSNFVCGIQGSGNLSCWGAGSLGQLGSGGTTASSLPAPVSGGPWASVSAGNTQACAVKTAGTIWCWGNNANNQLGDGTVTQRNSPTQVGVASDWVAVSAGGAASCGVRSAGSLWCWGDNSAGAVGDGSLTQRSTPVQIGAGNTWQQVAVTGYAEFSSDAHSCAIRTDESLWCWGGNAWGQLGDGSNTQRTSPTAVSSATPWGYITVSDTYSMGLRG